MASPFSIFRKHQKTLMVVLVIGSMIAFTGESLFTGAGKNTWLLGALLGTGLAVFAGFKFGRPIQYAIGGAIVGGLLGFAGPRLAGGGGFESRVGSFDEERMTQLVSERRIANGLIQECRQRAIGVDFGGPPFTFVPGYTIERDIIIGEALKQEADEMGIMIDNEAVNKFIDEQTFKRLSEEDYLNVLKQLTINGTPLSESQVYDLLRDQIKAKLALQTLMPYRDQDSVTPETYYTMHRRMNVRQQMAFTPVPVDSFLDQVGEPSDSDISTLFDKYKDRLPNPETAEPGFYQLLKMRVAYVEVDTDLVEAGLAEITEDDIKEYYEENKKVQFIDKEAELPEDPEDMELPAIEELDKAENEKSSDEKPAAGDLKIIDDKKAEGDADNKEEKNKDADGDAKEDDGDCGTWQDETAETQSAADVVESSTQAAEAGQDTTAPGTGLAAPRLSLQPSQDDDPLDIEDPFKKELKFKPLEDVRDQIKQILTQQRSMKEVDTLIAGALTEMQRLGEMRDDLVFEQSGDPDDDGKKTLAALEVKLCRELKAYADSKPGLVYAETPLATGYELLDREEYPVGSAMPPGSQFRRGAANVVQTLFGAGEGALFEPARAELFPLAFGEPVSQYAYWAIGQVPEHEPKLSEPGIREEVAKAWKRDEARPKAKARAEALAKMVTDGISDDNTMTDILKEETQTGDNTTAKLIVTSSLPFTWMKTSSAASPQGQPAPVRLSQLEGVEGMSNDFMDYVFNKLKSEEVGVTSNRDKSIYYVVQPLNRFPTDEDDVESARETFLTTKHFEFNSPMPGLVKSEVFGRQNREWLKRFEEKYEINWEQQ